MNFIADLHIHSRFSMATSKQLNVRHLSAWAMRKGIQVLGTGDFTHPAWRAELRENLMLDENSGLYASRDDPENSPFFCLQAEISSIYKKGGKTRKVHNLVFAPNFDAAEAICRKLALIGNLDSDGRPILGLDSRDLLEIVLEASSRAFLIPAHIWTPWFSLFGSRSGFDRIEDCYGDLTSHIFALETGLSSDPPMNRCLSALDKFALVSNSDAHSGANLGREANLFAGSPAYDAMFAALRMSASRKDDPDAACHFLGTLEFYPEEGKYHLDGHRACNVSLDPAESRELDNICPVCGKPLTIGVLHRVMALADRQTPPSLEREPEARMLVPLAEIISQILGCGPNTRKAGARYEAALAELGSELDILCSMPEERIRSWWEPLGEAVSRVRHGKVGLNPGFDGQYGSINIFTAEELEDLRGGKIIKLFPETGKKTQPSGRRNAPRHLLPLMEESTTNAAPIFSEDQMKAINAGPGPVFTQAGPGSGKTRVLVGRIARLLKEGEDKILALTFTRRAAGEIRERLEDACHIRCETLHSLAFALLHEERGEAPRIVGEDQARRIFSLANPDKKIWEEISLAREKNLPIPPGHLSIFQRYQEIKKEMGGCLDYADLQTWLLENADAFRGRWRHVLVDEAQDLSPAQLQIVTKLLPDDGEGFFGIGDPDQAIYSFRGASGLCGEDFRRIWPNLKVLSLGISYRAAQRVLDMAVSVLNGRNRCGRLVASAGQDVDLRLFTAANEHAEARWIARNIKRLIGPASHSLRDSTCSGGMAAPGDIAILARIKTLFPPIMKALEEEGIPYDIPTREEFWLDEQCANFIQQARQSDGAGEPSAFLESLMRRDAGHKSDWKLLAAAPAFARLDKFWRECGDWETFFSRIAWLHEAELTRGKARNVRMLTIHASKGLEFQAVFLPAMEQGILPYDARVLTKADRQTSAEEEARLFYVGITRAASQVFLSHSRKRRLYGRELGLEPSPLLDAARSFCRLSRNVRRAGMRTESLSLFGITPHGRDTKDNL